MFIVGGAFDGIQDIIKHRLGDKTIGFGTDSAEATEITDDNVMQHVIPSDLLQFGLIPEFIGRLPILTALKKLNEDDLVRILSEPKNALVKQYTKLMNLDGVDLTFKPEALKAMAKLAIARNTGARGLRSIVEDTMRDVMYNVPSDDNVKEVVVTKEAVDGEKEPELIYDNK